MLFIIIGILVILVIAILFSGYKKAPPDTAFIISGMRKKIIIGKASVKIPFLERMDKLSLKLIAIDVKTTNAVPTADYINIQVDAAVNVKISSDPPKLALAAENFLNQNTQYIANIAREVLEGNMREIVGRMRLEEMVSDRQKFANLVKENAEPDLAAMGLDIVSFNVQNFSDGQGGSGPSGQRCADQRGTRDRQEKQRAVPAEIGTEEAGGYEEGGSGRSLQHPGAAAAKDHRDRHCGSEHRQAGKGGHLKGKRGRGSGEGAGCSGQKESRGGKIRETAAVRGRAV